MLPLSQIIIAVTSVVAICGTFVSSDDGRSHHEYCVVGAGPGGLQIAYFLYNSGRDYIVYEKGLTAGTFYTKFPIHRTLISINKRNTGKTNKEFNFRHDWNSLISRDESVVMGRYSKDIFPHADYFVQYLKDFATKFNINVKYNTTISNIGQRNEEDGQFHVNDQHNQEYTCTRIIIATGIAKPNVPTEAIRNFTVGYHELSTDLDEFEGKSVLILGRGNSAFETAQYIMGRTNFIHMMARSRVKLSWSTHYVGDLRAINNGLLDTYQLKSLDGLLEGDANDLPIYRNEVDGRLYIDTENLQEKSGLLNEIDNDAVREGYDMIISCMGFSFDPALFNESANFKFAGKKMLKKYPRITYQYESPEIPGIFYAGTNTHSLDYRRSAGGFIHGFRYSARSLHRILENRYHNVPWPHVNFPSAINVIPHMLKRLNEASDIYQMFSVLCEVIIFSEDETAATYLPAYPCALVTRIPKVSGHPVPGKLVVVAMEYGKNASGPAKDVFREDRAVGTSREAHNSNFLHPVLYYYKKIPTDWKYLQRPMKWILPIPDRIHHIVEDFTTVFDAPVTHVLSVRRFFEYILRRDLRQFYVEQCMALSLIHI